jgi:hypothetical protein
VAALSGLEPRARPTGSSRPSRPVRPPAGREFGQRRREVARPEAASARDRTASGSLPSAGFERPRAGLHPQEGGEPVHRALARVGADRGVERVARGFGEASASRQGRHAVGGRARPAQREPRRRRGGEVLGIGLAGVQRGEDARDGRLPGGLRRPQLRRRRGWLRPPRRRRLPRRRPPRPPALRWRRPLPARPRSPTALRRRRRTARCGTGTARRRATRGRALRGIGAWPAPRRGRSDRRAASTAPRRSVACVAASVAPVRSACRDRPAGTRSRRRIGSGGATSSRRARAPIRVRRCAPSAPRSRCEARRGPFACRPGPASRPGRRSARSRTRQAVARTPPKMRGSAMTSRSGPAAAAAGHRFGRGLRRCGRFRRGAAMPRAPPPDGSRSIVGAPFRDVLRPAISSATRFGRRLLGGGLDRPSAGPASVRAASGPDHDGVLDRVLVSGCRERRATACRMSSSDGPRENLSASTGGRSPPGQTLARAFGSTSGTGTHPATMASSIAGPSGAAATERDAGVAFHGAAAFALIAITSSGAIASRRPPPRGAGRSGARRPGGGPGLTPEGGARLGRERPVDLVVGHDGIRVYSGRNQLLLQVGGRVASAQVEPRALRAGRDRSAGAPRIPAGRTGETRRPAPLRPSGRRRTMRADRQPLRPAAARRHGPRSGSGTGARPGA